MATWAGKNNLKGPHKFHKINIIKDESKKTWKVVGPAPLYILANPDITLVIKCKQAFPQSNKEKKNFKGLPEEKGKEEN